MPRPPKPEGESPIQHIRFTKALWARVGKAAREAGLSASAWVREAVEEKLDRQDGNSG